MKVLLGILERFRRFLWPSFQEFNLKYVEDIPDKYRGNIIYIIGTQNTTWLLTFLCPCGCQAKVHLNLLSSDSPFWNFTIVKQRISINPSIRSKYGCKSHFWITKGRVRWFINHTEAGNPDLLYK